MVTLRADNLSKSFGGLTALSDVSIDLHPGEIHGLIGPNGSGKTTLLNMLCGYYTPDRGNVRIGTTDLTGMPVQARAHQGITRTFQKPRPLPALSALENAMLGGWTGYRATLVQGLLALPRARRSDAAIRARARDMLTGVGLGYALDRRAALLDHGELRFLEIARALVPGPRFVLLDEPAGGLTDQEIGALSDVVLTLRDAGIGVLIVEHHTDFVFRVCDRVTVLDLGRLLCQGSPEQVRTDPDVISVYLGA